MTATTVLQLTDLHLLADDGGTVNQVPTRATFLEVLAACRGTGLVFDHLILTGDLAHDESREAYGTLRDLLAPMRCRVQIIPGNHDNRCFIRETFADGKASGPPDDSVTFSVGAGRWRLIGLDTQIPGEVAGAVSDPQLVWLQSELHAHRYAPTIVFLHHPPLAIQPEWVARMGLRNQDSVREILHAAPQVRVVSAGHIHRDSSVRDGAFDVFCTPSTAYQYRRQDESVVLDPLPPGFRIFQLRDDGYETKVIRLPVLGYPAGRAEP